MDGKYQFVKLTENQFGVNNVKYGVVDSNGILYFEETRHYLKTYLQNRVQFNIKCQIVPKSEVIENKIRNIDLQIKILQDKKLNIVLESPEKLVCTDTFLFAENDIY